MARHRKARDRDPVWKRLCNPGRKRLCGSARKGQCDPGRKRLCDPAWKRQCDPGRKRLCGRRGAECVRANALIMERVSFLKKRGAPGKMRSAAGRWIFTGIVPQEKGAEGLLL